jgi:threonine/homoserine efflux transporter RhtA
VVPLLVAAGAWVFLKERLGVRAVIAIAASLAGVAALSLGGVDQASASNPALGNALELLAMFAAAGSMLSIKRLTERYDAWLLTGLQAIVGAAFFLPFALADGLAPLLTAPLATWAGIAYLGIAVSLGAFGMYNTALKLMPASRAALAINLVPAVAVLTGWFGRGESLSAVQLVACVAIVGARVGSVDKFQGQEAPVCILSLCSSYGEYGSRGLAFILDRNRVNVAISRAQCLAVVVADPRIAATTPGSLDEMMLTNLFCKLTSPAEI